jgi:hypothetical protein
METIAQSAFASLAATAILGIASTQSPLKWQEDLHRLQSGPVAVPFALFLGNCHF